MFGFNGGGAPGSTYRVLLNLAPVEGGGTGNEPPPKAPEPKPEDKGADIAKAVEAIIAKNGSAADAVRVLMAENYDLRDKNRQATARVPAEGAVVLSGDDVKHWSKYKALGAPSDLEKSITEGKEAKTTVQGYLREKHLAAVETVSGMKASVLATLAGGLEIEIVEKKDSLGKPVKDRSGAVEKIAVVKGEGDIRTPLDDYAAQHWTDFLPALKGAEAKARQDGSPNPRPGQQRRPEVRPKGTETPIGERRSLFR